MKTFQRNCLYRYRSPMGAIGAGFLIEFAGREQHSVAWPDGAARRYKTDELAELHIECYEDDGPTSTDPLNDPDSPEFREYHDRVEAWIASAIENGATEEELQAFGEANDVAPSYLRFRIEKGPLTPAADDVPSDPEGAEDDPPSATTDESIEDVETTGVPEQTTAPSSDETTGAAEPEPDAPEFTFMPDDTEANNIREYLRTFPNASNQGVIAALNKHGMEVSSSQVSTGRKQLAKLAEKARDAATEGEK